MFTYSLIMAQMEFGIISIAVGKNVVESELKLQFFFQFLMYYKFWGFNFWHYYKFILQMAVIQYFCLLFSHYSQFLHTPIILKTRVLWNTYPVHCCCMKLCETQLIAEEDYKFARTHTFALLTMVIALCTIKHLWIWTCWTNCTVFSMSIRKVQTYIQRARKRCDMDCISDLRVYSVWDVTWIALVISSDLCSVWQFHIFHIAMTGSSLLSSCSVFLPN